MQSLAAPPPPAQLLLPASPHTPVSSLALRLEESFTPPLADPTDEDDDVSWFFGSDEDTAGADVTKALAPPTSLQTKGSSTLQDAVCTPLALHVAASAETAAAQELLPTAPVGAGAVDASTCQPPTRSLNPKFLSAIAADAPPRELREMAFALAHGQRDEMELALSCAATLGPQGCTSSSYKAALFCGSLAVTLRFQSA